MSGIDQHSTGSSNSFKSQLLREIYSHIDIAVPVCMSFLMRKSSDIVSVIAIGHLGSNYLSAAGIASVTANVSGNSMVWGLTGAVSTICSQAVGMKDNYTLCVTLQRSILVILICVCLPVTFLWLFSATIMRTLGQNPQIAHYASLYMRYLLPGLWALGCSACIQTWLHTQSKTRAVAIVTLITALLHPIWCYLLIYYFKFGFIGAAISVSITKTLEFILLILYISIFSNTLNECEFRWLIKESFQNWWPFLKLGLPNMLMMTEWWASEIIIFLSGLLPDAEYQVSAMSIYQNLLSICFMLPQGFHVSGSTLVGNALGENRPRSAALASRVSPFLAATLSSCAALFIGIFRPYVGRLFTDDPHVLAVFSKILPLVMVYVIADGTQAALTGVIKGMGKQSIGGPVVLFSYYAVGIPLSLVLSFRWGAQLGIVGLCLGTTVGTYVHMILYIIVVLRTNWQKEAKTVQMSKFNGQPDYENSNTRGKGIVVPSSDSDDESNEEWWAEIDFLGNDYERSEKSRPRIQSMHDVAVVAYNRIARQFGWKEKLSEYEMVKNQAETILDDLVVL